MIIYLILIQLTQGNWNVPIQYSSLCTCSQLSQPNLCSSSQFCQLNLDFECTDLLNYNCSYFNEQTVLYLCSQLDRCVLKDGKCIELNNCTELTGSTNQECIQQSNRCGTSQNNICQLTECSSYLNQNDCNNSLFNIRFDNIGYGSVCYWNNQNSQCNNLLCENVSVDQCLQYTNLCQINTAAENCNFVWEALCYNGWHLSKCKQCLRVEQHTRLHLKHFIYLYLYT
ncbi:unnamed protein product (macronuclear) [Paramecium tetraurelia]|uniref:Uncharacterized protein n=1 Tax=Paramecium tetraurelia TaxID=5888 RepID=A0D6Y6_PARTE|nr:uncharacterized protein GSPATT00001844001 [Paramecium tetraurelia]CAK78803.1 unnamed protein product [Paramecium tetraurelia]|eukprot:XP_001446200.1 hypothetical protein (macronuclear) [Paramecium tetraurelia strain d4-2]